MKPDAIALLDWDNTLRPGFTMPDWTAFLTERRLFDAACHRDLTGAFADYARGGVGYETLAGNAVSWYGKGIKGQPTSLVRESAREFAAVDRENLFGFTEPFISTLKTVGLRVFLVSGCPEDVLVAYRPILGLDGVHGIQVEEQDGHYLDEIRLDTAGRDGKRTAAALLAGSADVRVAAGDSESDQALFEHATIAIVVDNPELRPDSPVVRHWRSNCEAAVLVESFRDAFAGRSR